MHVMILNEETLEVVKEAFKFRNQLLQGLVRVQIVARNRCLYDENHGGVRHIETSILANDHKMEILSDLIAQLEAADGDDT